MIDLEQARAERRERRKQTANKKQNKGDKSLSEELSGRKVNKRNRRRLIYCCVIIGIMVAIGVSIFHVYLLQKEYNETIAQQKTLEAKKQRLTEELGNVSNPEYIEQQARQQLKMIKPGEVLYILPTEEQKATAAAAAAESIELLPAGEASD